MAYALIDHKNIVQEVIASDPTGRYHPAIIWTPCPDGTLSGAIHTDGTFQNPPTSPPAPDPVTPPPPPVILTKGEFLLRFTLPELVAAKTSTDPGVTTWLWVLDHLTVIVLANPETALALGHLVEAGILTQDRATAILTA